MLNKYGPNSKAASASKWHSRNSRGGQGSSSRSDDSTETETESRRSSGFVGRGWEALKWAGGSGFGSGSGLAGGAAGFGSGARTSRGPGGPSQAGFERNFDDSLAPPHNHTPDSYSDPYSSDPDALHGDGDETMDADGEMDVDAPLPPGIYVALYDFEPEGTAEMALVEGQEVRVVGRGGGVGWAVVIREKGDVPTAGGQATGDGAVKVEVSVEGKEGVAGEEEYALVPESYLMIVREDEEEAEDRDDGDDERE